MSEPTVTHLVTRENGTTYEVQVPRRLVYRFKRLCVTMATLLDELSEYAPESGLYLQEGTPHLMLGPTHIRTSYRYTSCQGNSLVSGMDWPRSGGGGW